MYAFVEASVYWKEPAAESKKLYTKRQNLPYWTLSSIYYTKVHFINRQNIPTHRTCKRTI